MKEKMLLAIEAAIWRVLHSALKQADAMYPNRDRDSNEYLMHLKCVQVIMGWHDVQVASVLKMRLAARPGRSLIRSPVPLDASDDWDLLLSLFAGPLDSWMMSVGLAALPYDLRLMLVAMTHIIELAVAGQELRCLNELHALAESLALRSGTRAMGGKRITSLLPQEKDKQSVERDAQGMADRFKAMMQPSLSKKTTSALKRSILGKGK